MVKKQKKTLSKTDLINEVTGSVQGFSKAQVSELIDATLQTIKGLVAADNKITLIGFGTFEQGVRNAREGHNPLTGEKIKIKKSKRAVFRAGKAFKDLLNGEKPKDKK